MCLSDTLSNFHVVCILGDVQIRFPHVKMELGGTQNQEKQNRPHIII